MNYLLLCEVNYIKDHIRALQDKQKEATDDMARALEQSGDGWHDNAAFQAAQELARNLSLQAEEYVTLLRNSTALHGEHRKPIGKKFVVSVNGEDVVYFITGTSLDHSAYREHIQDGSIPLSHRSPLGTHILGLSKDTPSEFRGKIFILKEISSS